MSRSYEEAMRKANEIREELIRREDDPPQAWEIEQFLEKSGWDLIRTFLQGFLDNLADAGDLVGGAGVNAADDKANVFGLTLWHDCGLAARRIRHL